MSVPFIRDGNLVDPASNYPTSAKTQAILDKSRDGHRLSMEDIGHLMKSRRACSTTERLSQLLRELKEVCR